MSTNNLIVLLALFCMIMLGVIVWILVRQRTAFKSNQKRIQDLQQMLEKQYTHRVESIRVIAGAMLDKQCEATEGCIRLKQLVEQVEPELLSADVFKVIQLIYSETEHMPIKEQWKQLDKKAKFKFTQQRVALEAKYGQEIHVSLKALQQHEFSGYGHLEKSPWADKETHNYVT